MNFLRFALACAASALLAAPGWAGEMATANVTDSQIGANEYQYDLTLNNVGTTTIGTFWFSWVPGLNFMSATPTNINLPAGWTDNITTGPGSAIQWLAGSNLLAAGTSLSGFSFDSTLTPAELAGNALSPNQTYPVATSFIYSGAPFSDGGYQFVAAVSSPVPLPSSFGLLTGALTAGGLILVRRRTNNIAGWY
jgi:hypothetical protein